MATGTLAAEHDIGVDHDFDHDMDHGIHQGIDHDHIEVSHGESSSLSRVLSVFGFGKVPVSIILCSYLILWGFLGFVSNQLLRNFLFFPGIYVWISMAIATVLSIILVRWIAFGIAAKLPSTETYSTTSEELVGRMGTVTEAITSSYGKIHVHDRFGNLHQVDGRVEPRQARIPSGEKVILTDYNGERREYAVCTEEELNRRTRR